MDGNITEKDNEDINKLKNILKVWKEQKTLLFQKNITELSGEELDRMGLIIHSRFEEKKKRYLAKNEILILEKFNEYSKKHDCTLSLEDFRNNENTLDQEYLKLCDEYNNAKQKAIKILDIMKKTDEEKEKIKRYKQIKGLKYNKLKYYLNYIQISVILGSTAISLIETLQSTLDLGQNITLTLLPIGISTYIGLILAVTRFFKFEDHKETLMKLDEKQSIVINRLNYRYKQLLKYIPISPTSRFEEIDQLIDVDFNKDGLNEMISETYQEYDINMSFIDKLIYKRQWLRLKILDINQQNFHKDLVKIVAEKESERNMETYKDMNKRSFFSRLKFWKRKQVIIT